MGKMSEGATSDEGSPYLKIALHYASKRVIEPKLLIYCHTKHILAMLAEPRDQAIGY